MTTRSLPTPDRSVRTAWVADTPAMGRVQSAAWREAYAGLLDEQSLAELTPDGLADTWATALRRPPLATYRALVALETNVVVGFATTGPSEDPDARVGHDAEMSLLVVEPSARGRGHGSRLLAAVADTARADGFSRLTTWVLAEDDATRRFLQTAGWAADGAHREVGAPADDAADDAPATETTARQVRLHTSVEDT